MFLQEERGWVPAALEHNRISCLVYLYNRHCPSAVLLTTHLSGYIMRLMLQGIAEFTLRERRLFPELIIQDLTQDFAESSYVI